MPYHVVVITSPFLFFLVQFFFTQNNSLLTESMVEDNDSEETERTRNKGVNVTSDSLPTGIKRNKKASLLLIHFRIL